MRPGLGPFGVSMDEHQQLHRHFKASEERVRQLEQYIKDQSAKHAFSGETQLKEKDNEVQRLQDLLISNEMEHRHVNCELQAMLVYLQQKVNFWEEGARRLLATTEGILGQHSGHPNEDPEKGHFGRTATKLTLTLSEDKEGGDVGSLRRILKDVLSQNSSDLRGNKEKASKRTGKGLAMHMDNKTEQLRHVGDRGLVCMDNDGGLSLGDEVSPTHNSEQLIGDTHLSTNRSPTHDVSLQSLLHLAEDLRQLVATSQQLSLAWPCTASTSSCMSPEGSPRHTGSPNANHANMQHRASMLRAHNGNGHEEHSRVQQILDSIAPTRRDIAQDIIAVEKMLRSLDHDLRLQCEELLGHAEFMLGDYHACNSADVMSAVEDEVLNHLPMNHEGQLLSLSALRRAQQRSSTVLAQFVLLPQKLKTVFDLTKTLSLEAGARVSKVCSEQRAGRGDAPYQKLPTSCRQCESLPEQWSLPTYQERGHDHEAWASGGPAFLPLSKWPMTGCQPQCGVSA